MRSGRVVEGGGVGPQPRQPLGQRRRTAGSTGRRRRGVVGEHLVERVEVGAHGGELLLDVLEAVGQPRPPAGRAVRLPDLALRLHLEQRGVQVGDGPAGTDHVLGLLAQPATQPVAHVDAALRAPLLGGGGGDEVGGGALEDDRLEHVERGAHTVEHGQLLGPGDERSSPASSPVSAATCAVRSTSAGQRRVEQALEAAHRVVGVGPRAQVRAVPGRVGGADPERTELAGAHEVGGQLGATRRVEHARDVGRQPHGRLGRRPGRGQAGELLQGVVRGHAPRARARRAARRRRPAGARACATSSLRRATTPCASTAGASRVIAPSRRREIADRQPASGATSSSRSPRPSAASRSASAVAARRWPGHVEDGAAGRGGVGDERGQGAGDVGAGGGVDEQVRAGRDDVEHVLLRGVEVADAALEAGVAVAARRARAGRDAAGAGLVDAGERGDHLVPLERAGQVVEVVDEDLAGVHEGADDDALAQREVVEHGLARATRAAAARRAGRSRWT